VGDVRFQILIGVVIETTGLADPAPIAQTLLIDPMLRHQVRLANIITTIDGMHGAAQLNQHPEALRQAAIADRLVVTKTDLISAEQFEALARQLLRLNPTARVFDVHSRDFDGSSLLFEGVADPATKLTEVRRWVEAASAADHGDHGGHDAHEHLGAIHSSDISSFSARIEEEIDWAAFGVWLTALLHRLLTRCSESKGC
jgi:G3E family GTPase